MKNLTLIIFLFFIFQSIALGQAYCSLRNPSSQIVKFFPTNSGYKTTVGTIDKNVSENVSNIVGLKLHKNEIGRHKLYIVKKGTQTLGLVHSRSDLSEWGIVETVWSLNVDLTVSDYSFQRCRSSLKKDLLSKAYKSRIVGKNLYELKYLLKNLRSSHKNTEINSLLIVVVSAALKAITVTNICWQDDLNALRKKELNKSSKKLNLIILTSSLKKAKNKLDYTKNFVLSIKDKELKVIYSPLTSMDYETYKKKCVAINNLWTGSTK
jgi:hypothetical protein